MNMSSLKYLLFCRPKKKQSISCFIDPKKKYLLFFQPNFSTKKSIYCFSNQTFRQRKVFTVLLTKKSIYCFLLLFFRQKKVFTVLQLKYIMFTVDYCLSLAEKLIEQTKMTKKIRMLRYLCLLLTSFPCPVEATI